MKFHVNPKTGNTGICKAQSGNCPFGSVEDHFDSREEAQRAYEKKQEEFEKWNNASIFASDPKSYTLGVFSPQDQDFTYRWDHSETDSFMKELNKCPDKARLVTESGWIFEKSEFWSSEGESSWTVREIPSNNNLRVERNKTYNIGVIMRSLQHGARLEFGGNRPVKKPETI